MSYTDPVLLYGEDYRLKNGYKDWSGGYLDNSPNGCPPNINAKGTNRGCVSTASYGQGWKNERDGAGCWWRIFSATGKPDFDPVLANDIVYLRSELFHDFLDTRGSGCQDNYLCVSAGRQDREPGTGRWKILLQETGGENVEIRLRSGFHLLNGWNDWRGGYLDTRGDASSCGTNFTGNVPLRLCVSTHDGWNGKDDPATTQWMCERD